jgi:hypothetical protein
LRWDAMAKGWHEIYDMTSAAEDEIKTLQSTTRTMIEKAQTMTGYILRPGNVRPFGSSKHHRGCVHDPEEHDRLLTGLENL